VISNGIVNGHDIDITDDNRSPFERKTSDTQYQHALYLKAKLEYLKGNTKKSLKLCSEAQNTVDRNPGKEMSSIHHAMFNNNVAVVHQTSGQFFLAMHYFAHALEHIENALNESECIKENIVNVSHDGTINQISVKQVLYNAAICAQECGNYVTSSECMSRYLDMAHDYMVRDPFPWLHLAESCIGKLNSVPISFEYLWLLEFILTR
jgi:tetratricopeptide (TPR) repeat protein